MGNNLSVSLENEKIEEFELKLYSIASKIETIDEWKNYIKEYQEVFCSLLARFEAELYKSNSRNVHRSPIAVITGGQPGSGKSALIATYTKLLKQEYGIDVLVNNADFYRFCLPGSYLVAKDFPEYASIVTDPVVKKMREKLISESVSQRQSIIIENTLGDTLAVDQMQKAKTHDVWIAIMAVPREESLLSDFERYIKMKEANQTARLVSVEAHDKRYFALDENVQNLNKLGLRILVHSRGKTEKDLANIEYDSFNQNNKKYSCVREATDSIRRKSLNQNIDGYSERLKTIREKMMNFGMTLDEEKELEELESIINESILKYSKQISYK